MQEGGARVCGDSGGADGGGRGRFGAVSFGGAAAQM